MCVVLSPPSSRTDYIEPNRERISCFDYFADKLYFHMNESLPIQCVFLLFHSTILSLTVYIHNRISKFRKSAHAIAILLCLVSCLSVCVPISFFFFPIRRVRSVLIPRDCSQSGCRSSRHGRSIGRQNVSSAYFIIFEYVCRIARCC